MLHVAIYIESRWWLMRRKDGAWVRRLVQGRTRFWSEGLTAGAGVGVAKEGVRKKS